MTHGLRIPFFGSSLVSAYWSGAATYYRGLEDFLEPDREVLVVRDGDEVAGHVASLDEARARRIGAAARARVLARHTYARRAAEVEALLTGDRVVGAEALR